MTVHAATCAGVTLRTEADLLRDEAVTWDFQRDFYRQAVGEHVPAIDAAEAGAHLVALAARHDLTLYETFITDLAGHGRIPIAAGDVVERLDRFFSGVLARARSPSRAAERPLTLVVCSDHGNIEEPEHRRHTRNPVPLIALGPGSRVVRGRALDRRSRRPAFSARWTCRATSIRSRLTCEPIAPRSACPYPPTRSRRAPSPEEDMIEVQGLTRRYGEFTAVEDVSFSVASGQIVGMLGPNGAGKTTTIRMITGFLPPTAGRVTLAGIDLEEKPVEARRQLGYLPENVALYTEMRVREYLTYRARLEGVRGRAAAEAIDRAIDLCLLSDVADQIISTLSKGFRQRVGLATAILHGPEVLILDEPTVGLDPKQIIAIRDLIRDLGRERTLLLSTHILPEVELLCQKVMIIDRGRIIAQGTPESLRQQWLGRTVVTVTLKYGAPDAASRLGALDGVVAVATDGAGASAGDRSPHTSRSNAPRAATRARRSSASPSSAGGSCSSSSRARRRSRTSSCGSRRTSPTRKRRTLPSPAGASGGAA